MIHHEGSDKIYMSEEMIGAYLEGKLAPHDARYVELLMERDADIASLVDDCKGYDDMFHQYGYNDAISYSGSEAKIPELDDSFILPEILDEVFETSYDNSTLELKFDIEHFGDHIIHFDNFFSEDTNSCIGD